MKKLLGLISLLLIGCGTDVPNNKGVFSGVVRSALNEEGQQTLVPNLKIKNYDVSIELKNGVVLVENFLRNSDKVLTDANGRFSFESKLDLTYTDDKLVCYEYCVDWETAYEYYCYDTVYYDEFGYPYYVGEDCYDYEAYDYCVATAEDCGYEPYTEYAKATEIRRVKSQIGYTAAGKNWVTVSADDVPLTSNEGDDNFLLDVSSTFDTSLPFGYDGLNDKQFNFVGNNEKHHQASALNNREFLRLTFGEKKDVSVMEAKISEAIKQGKLSEDALENYRDSRKAMQELEAQTKAKMEAAK